MTRATRESPRDALLLVPLVCMAVASRSSAQDSPAAGYEGPREKLHVYLLIGQSNMAGRAPFTKEESGVIRRCYLFNDKDEWEPARNPLNRYSTIRKGLGMQKMNPGYTFAKTMLEKDNAISIGVVVNAKGGTSIRKWARGSKFYKEALRRTKTAQKTGVLKGVLWHQGESDAKDAQYLDKLKALVADLRKDLNEPNLPFVAGQILNERIVNEQIAKLPDTVPFTGFAGSDGLKGQDRWHFDAGSMRLLGRRYAEAMLEIRNRPREVDRKRARPPTPPERPALSAREEGQKKAERLFRVAQRAERMGQRGAAASLYSKIVKDYPETSVAKGATERLDSLRK